MPDTETNRFQNQFVRDKQLDRLEEVVDKLTNVSSDISKMLAVHESRLNTNEKDLGKLEALFDTRTSYIDTKMEKDLQKVEAYKEDIEKKISALEFKISGLEKLVWQYIGGGAVIVFLLTYGPNIVKFLEKVP